MEQQTQVVHIPKTHQKLAQDDPSLIFIDVRSSILGNPIIIETSLYRVVFGNATNLLISSNLNEYDFFSF